LLAVYELAVQLQSPNLAKQLLKTRTGTKAKLLEIAARYPHGRIEPIGLPG
jgi:hypothetical protein